jgi:hypothetical protein
VNDKPKRVRQRRASLQLETALRDAEILSSAEPTLENVERMRLVKTRLTVLNRKASREQVDTIARLTKRIAALELENARLRQEADARPRYSDPSVELALARYEAEKQQRNNDVQTPNEN